MLNEYLLNTTESTFNKVNMIRAFINFIRIFHILTLTVVTKKSNVIKIVIIINKNKSIIEEYTRYNSRKEA